MAFDRQFMAGAFLVTWNSIEVGYTEAGFEWIIQLADNVPVQDDRHGLAILDAAVEQIQTMYIRLESMYFNTNAWTSLLPMLGEDNGLVSTTAGQFIVQNSLAKGLNLFPMTGYAVTFNKQWDFATAYPVDPVTLLFAARQLRRFPGTFQIFPDVGSSDGVEATWFTRTTAVP